MWRVEAHVTPKLLIRIEVWNEKRRILWLPKLYTMDGQVHNSIVEMVEMYNQLEAKVEKILSLSIGK